MGVDLQCRHGWDLVSVDTTRLLDGRRYSLMHLFYSFSIEGRWRGWIGYCGEKVVDGKPVGKGPGTKG